MPSHLVYVLESFATSLQVGFSYTAISYGLRHRQSIDVPKYQPLYIAGRSQRVPYRYGVAVRWWELCHVWLDTIRISYFLTLGHHLSFSIYVLSLYWARVFGHAVQGFQPHLVYLLGGLCRVVSYRVRVFRGFSHRRICRFDVVSIEIVEFRWDPFYWWRIRCSSM